MSVRGHEGAQSGHIALTAQRYAGEACGKVVGPEARELGCRGGAMETEAGQGLRRREAC